MYLRIARGGVRNCEAPQTVFDSTNRGHFRVRLELNSHVDFLNLTAVQRVR